MAFYKLRSDIKAKILGLQNKVQEDFQNAKSSACPSNENRQDHQMCCQSTLVDITYLCRINCFKSKMPLYAQKVIED